MNKFLSVFLKVLTGLVAAYVSVWTILVATMMFMIMGATISNFSDKLQGYAFMLFVGLVAFSIVFGVCYLAKHLITKVIRS